MTGIALCVALLLWSWTLGRSLFVGEERRADPGAASGGPPEHGTPDGPGSPIADHSDWLDRDGRPVAMEG